MRVVVGNSGKLIGTLPDVPDPFDELCDLARQINPALPEDLSNHVVTISLSKDYSSAVARKRPE